MRKTYEAVIHVEVDGGGVGEMLTILQAFTKSLSDTDQVKVIGFQWDNEKGEALAAPDIRKPGWRRYLGARK